MRKVFYYSLFLTAHDMNLHLLTLFSLSHFCSFWSLPQLPQKISHPFLCYNNFAMWGYLNGHLYVQIWMLWICDDVTSIHIQVLHCTKYHSLPSSLRRTSTDSSNSLSTCNPVSLSVIPDSYAPKLFWFSHFFISYFSVALKSCLILELILVACPSKDLAFALWLRTTTLRSPSAYGSN
jgi:hypothetical protein